jgi:DNA invertase Pin-like site-specific DNA recombinase
VGSAAVYARISSDDGQALGVSRQLEDCRKLAASLGWAVGEEYVDNDISAYSGKPRPEYQRMPTELADGAPDAVIVYHVDRLTRRPVELEQFLDVLTAAKVRHVRFVTGGDLDIGNGDGLMVLRMLLAMAANELATKSRRVKRKMEHNASAGLPHGGFRRPFGYAEDKITIVPAEADVIRTLAERLVAGESLRSLASWLDAQAITTVGDGPHVREGDLVQRAGAPGSDVLVELRADPADLALADPGAAHGDDQVIDPAGAHALDIRLHDHRVQREVDAPARLEQRGKERPRPGLGDLHRHVTDAGCDGLGATAVALGRARVGALVRAGADVRGRLPVHQGLQHRLEQLAHQVAAVGALHHLGELDQGRLVQGHRVSPFP